MALQPATDNTRGVNDNDSLSLLEDAQQLNRSKHATYTGHWDLKKHNTQFLSTYAQK